MALVPGIRLLVSMRDAENSNFVERRSYDLQAKRQIGRGEAARHRDRRQTCQVTESECAARTYDPDRIRHGQVRDIDQRRGSGGSRSNESRISLEQARGIVTNLPAQSLDLDVVHRREQARGRPVDNALLVQHEFDLAGSPE